MPRLRSVMQQERPNQKDTKPDDETQLKAAQNKNEDELEDEEVVEVVEVDTPRKGQQEDATLALQRQIDALRKSEEVQRTQIERMRREREEAINKSRERDAQIINYQKEVLDKEDLAVSNALAAAQAEAEKAQQDIENAIGENDAKAQSDAYRRLARAESNIATLERGKEELEARKKAQPTEQQQQQQRVSSDPIDNLNLPDTAKDWLRAHPQFLTDPRRNSKLQAAHWDVLDEGLDAYSPAYFERIEEVVGLKKAEPGEPGERNREEEIREEEQRRNDKNERRTSIMSAPVSRQTPAANGSRRTTQIHLTREEREAADMAGISYAEYHKQKTKLNEYKADGLYGERR